MMTSQKVSDDIGNVMNSDHATDRAISALSKGDISAAQSLAQVALKRDSKDPYALLVAGLAYEAAGRYDLARQYFQVIVTNRPVATIVLPDDKGVMQERPVVDIALANLDKVDRLTGRSAAVSVAESGRARGAELPAFRPTDPESSVTGRFRILKRLLDEELITPDEYALRRAGNIGALLPLTGGIPAAGLERPIPDDSQIVARLRMLKDAIEAREMLPREAAGERAVILDGLLPAQPKVKAIPPLPPKDVLEVGSAVGRLERLRTIDMISADEAQKEKMALDQSLDRTLSAKTAAGNITGLKYGLPPPAQSAISPVSEKKVAQDASAKANWGVSLGLVGDEEEAKTQAAQIKAKFPEELGSKSLSVRKVTVKGGDKWQIVTNAESKDAARRLCKTMRLHRQACEAVTL